MERVAAEITNRTQRTALVSAHHALRRVLHHHQAVAAGNIHDGVHLAGHAGIMHRHDDLGAVCDGGFNLALVNVHGVGTNIHKHKCCTCQYESVGRTGKRVAGQDHLVAGLDVTQQCSHVQRGRTAGGQKHLLGMKAFFHPSVAFFRKLSVSADFMGIHCLLDVCKLVPHTRGYVE